MNLDEFSGIDQMIDPVLEEAGFAAGVVRGVRSFKVDSLGRLTGITYAQIWVPGENRAECRRNEGYSALIAGMQLRLDGLLGFDGDARPDQAAPHAMRDCKHGFYAYYDGSDDYHRPGYISAVVEGYGETVIGSRGFRSMKARIVALHVPDDVKPHIARMIARNYRDVAGFESFEQMVSEFPPDSAGNEPHPDTDPDFWTRPA